MTPCAGKPLRRWRRCAKWAGLLTCIVLAGAFAASLRWKLTIHRYDAGAWSDPTSWPGVAGQLVVIEDGFALATWTDGGQAARPDRRWRLAAERNGSPRMHWRPGLIGSPAVIIPLWLPLALVATPTALLLLIDHRQRPGVCRQCRYDLAGLASGPCPECGATR